MPVCGAGWVWGYLPTRSSISAGRSSRAGPPRRAPTPSPEFLRPQSSEDHLFLLSEHPPPLSPEPPPQGLGQPIFPRPTQRKFARRLLSAWGKILNRIFAPESSYF